MKKQAMIGGMLVLTFLSVAVSAQKMDEERMERDIEVAENVFNTLMRQKSEKRGFFPFEVEGNYLAGYGVTFRIPGDFNGNWIVAGSAGGIERVDVIGETDSYNFSYSHSDDRNDSDKRAPRRVNRDSINATYNQRIIDASKEFLADYGDLISQLAPDERIMFTNRGENNRFYFVGMNMPKRSLISVEATKSDMSQVRQGKMTRDQFLAKVRVINTTSVEDADPDLELLSSIFTRLYRVDLAKTYYTNEDVYYERLKDFGAIFYMNVFSSEETDYRKWRMPTQDLDNLDQAARDKKVIELYPLFEKEAKENLLEYGRTLKSLKESEVLAMNIKLTKCKECGIPSTLELSVKNEVIKQFNSGQITKEAAVAKVQVKKGPAQ